MLLRAAFDHGAIGRLTPDSQPTPCSFSLTSPGLTSSFIKCHKKNYMHVIQQSSQQLRDPDLASSDSSSMRNLNDSCDGTGMEATYGRHCPGWRQLQPSCDMTSMHQSMRSQVLFRRSKLGPARCCCKTRVCLVPYFIFFPAEEFLDICTGFAWSGWSSSSIWFAAQPEHFYSMRCPTIAAVCKKHIPFWHLAGIFST